MRSPAFALARKAYHLELLKTVLTVNAAGVPSNADKDNRLSVLISMGKFPEAVLRE